MSLYIIAWMIIIFLLTCTTPAFGVFHGNIKFKLNPNPEWSGLFVIYPEGSIKWVEFVGHFLMFFILIALLMAVLKKLATAVWIVFLYGVVIEILQPFFGRGAEFIDVIANTGGILIFATLYGIVRSVKRVGLL
ncbi:VanZ family protein [Virgibacillus sp. FSP13]